MKRYLLGLLLIATTNLYAQVNKEIYQEAEVKKSDEKIIFSEIKYDLPQLEQQLRKGKATIKGKMYAKKRNELGKQLIPALYGQKNAANTSVYLIPYTNYVKRYIRLKNSAEKPKKKTFVKLHEDVFKIRLEGITNSEGNFTFPNVKPGKYYVFSSMKTVTLVKKKYYNNGNVATDSYGRVIAEGYSSYNNYSSIFDYVENIVEVTEDGKTFFVNVSNIPKDQSEELKAAQKGG